MTDLSTRLIASFGSGYTIGRELGGGRMPSVYVALHPLLLRRIGRSS